MTNRLRYAIKKEQHCKYIFFYKMKLTVENVDDSNKK